MKTIALLSLICSLAIAQNAQTKPPTQTNGPCSPITQGSGNTVTVTCQNVDRSLADNIVWLVTASKNDGKMLKEILANTSAMRKALEGGTSNSTTIVTNGPQSPVTTGPNSPVIINPDVNPNAQITTYQCNGDSNTSGPAPNVGLLLSLNVGGPNQAALQKMVDLLKSAKYDELTKACVSQIQATPEWLTPHLFCAWAYGATNATDKARAELAIFDAKTGPAYDVGLCKQLSDVLHQNLHQ